MCFGEVVAVGRIPGCDLRAYWGGITSCDGKACNRCGTAKVAPVFRLASGVALARPDVRLGDAGKRPGAKWEGR